MPASNSSNPPRNGVALPLDLELARIFESGKALSNPEAHKRARELLGEIKDIRAEMDTRTELSDADELLRLRGILDRALDLRNEAAYGPAILRLPEIRAAVVTLNTRIQGLRRAINLLEHSVSRSSETG